MRIELFSKFLQFVNCFNRSLIFGVFIVPTCRTRLKVHWGLALGCRRGILKLAMFPRLLAFGADTLFGILGTYVEAALIVIDAVQCPCGLLAGLRNIRV